MSWQLIHLDDVAAAPWRNGEGTVRELLAWPNAQDWDWRICVAEIEHAGAFSLLDGVQRWFAVLSGVGVQLEVEGEERRHQLTPGSAPLCLDGALAVNCALLDGPAEAFHLMVREPRASAGLQRIAESFGTKVQMGRKVAVYTGEHRATVELDREMLEVPPYSLAWRALAEPATVQVWAESALWLEIWK
jgi:environmental stress-induced protein Ves